MRTDMDMINASRYQELIYQQGYRDGVNGDGVDIDLYMNPYYWSGYQDGITNRGESLKND